MKRRNLKPIIISALTAVAFGGLSVGTTFALFTDNAETRISVQSGTVKVSSAMTIESVASLNAGDTGNVVAEGKLSATLSQGGTVAVNSLTGEVSIEKMIPGDRVVLKMVNTNASNVAIKHRIEKMVSSYVFDGNTKVADTSNKKLGDKLTVKLFSDAGLTQEVTNYGTWSEPVTAETLSTYYIQIAFPDGDNGAILFGNENNDNVYQNKAADFAFALQAVQGNANTYTPDTSYGFADNYHETIGEVEYYVHEINSLSSLQAIGTYLASTDGQADLNPYFKITADIDVSQLTAPIATIRGVLDGGSHKLYGGTNGVTFDWSDGTSDLATEGGYGIFKREEANSTTEIQNLTIEGIHIKGPECVALLIGGHKKSSGPDSTVIFDNVTILNNCSIEATESKSGSLLGSAYGVLSLTVKNCASAATVTTVTSNAGGFVGTATNNPKTFVFTNNSFGGLVNGSSMVGSLIGQYNQGSPDLINVSNNVMNGVVRSTLSGNNQIGYFIAHPDFKYNHDNTTYEGNTVGPNGKIALNPGTEELNVTYAENHINDEDKISFDVGTWDEHWNEVVVKSADQLAVQLNGQNQFVVTEVANAAHYRISLKIDGKIASVSGNTATLYNTHGITIQGTYDSAAELQAGFGRITRAGYIFDDSVTNFALGQPLSNLSTASAYIQDGRMNFLRVSATGSTVTAIGGSENINKPVYLNGEWALVVQKPNALISPVGANFAYTIQALDNEGLVLAEYSMTDYVGSGMKPHNMAGMDFDSSANYSSQAYYEYAA